MKAPIISYWLTKFINALSGETKAPPLLKKADIPDIIKEIEVLKESRPKRKYIKKKQIRNPRRRNKNVN